MRFVIAKRRGRRGEGLGNELFAWAKGWIASQTLDARLIGPSWGLNPRKYYRNFRTPRWDVLSEEIGKRLPHFSFTENDYRQTGQIDFGDAIAFWADRSGLTKRRAWIVTVDGMYGGYPSIVQSRDFLVSQLLQSRDALRNVRLVKKSLSRKKLFVAVHMRSGEGFTPQAAGTIRGQFNVPVPGEWYFSVCSALDDAFRGHIQFRIFTDRESACFREAVKRFNPGQTRCEGLTECSDLLLMAHADLRICSISSYSLAANFLSGGPFVWYEPQLTIQDQVYSLWSHEDAQRQYSSMSSQSQRFVKQLAKDGRPASGPLHLGTAMAVGDTLHDDLKHCLCERLRLLDSRTNLLEYGALPVRYGLGCRA